MRCVKIAAFAGMAIVFVQMPSEAHAQGFFSKLFGGSSQQPTYQPQRAPQPMLQAYREPLSSRAPRERDRSDENRSSTSFSGKYRTLCVRTCDGYYWPVSFSVSRSGFYRDANICRSSCGGEARLFFHASSNSDTSEMVDISGRPYALLPNAYTYRKKVVEGCTCKPQPWAQSELDRHRMYAMHEADKARGRDAQGAHEVASKQKLHGPSDPAVGRAIGGSAHQVPPVAPADGATGEAPSAVAAGAEAAAGTTAAEVAAAAPSSQQPLAEATPQNGKRRLRSQTGTGNGGIRQAVARQGQPKPTQASAKLPGSNGGPFGLGAGGGKRWPGE